MAGRRKGGARRRTCVFQRYARANHTQASSRGETRWPGSVNTSRRVRPRRDGSYSRRQARRTIDETGDRDRAVEGTQSGRRPSRAQDGDDIRTHSPRSETSPTSGAQTSQDDIFVAFARHARRAQARGSRGRLKEGARATGAQQRAPTFGVVSTCIGQAGGEDEGTSPSSFCCQAGGGHASTTVGSLTRPTGMPRFEFGTGRAFRSAVLGSMHWYFATGVHGDGRVCVLASQ